MGRQTAIHAERSRCPIYTALTVIEGRWKPMICGRLRSEAVTFGGLIRAMPGITTKVLREQLAQLETDNIIARGVSTDKRPRVTYALTCHGRTLGPVFATLWTWGSAHLGSIEGASRDLGQTRTETR
jgi:DNA-binding HxlR family transcriptional regulator